MIIHNAIVISLLMIVLLSSAICSAFFFSPSHISSDRRCTRHTNNNLVPLQQRQIQETEDDEDVCLNQHRQPGSATNKATNVKEEEEDILLPETNPNFDPNTQSLSSVPYSLVISGINALYPPNELSKRNAASRSDGYWKYVERGEEPPQEFTYGEFDIDFFGMLLDRSWEFYIEGIRGRRKNGTNVSDTTIIENYDEEDQQHRLSKPWTNKTFCDIGSGTGRLVLSAAALHPRWKLCRGLEILEGLHNMSSSIIENQCRLDDKERDRLGIADDHDYNVKHEYFLRIPDNNSSDTTTSTALHQYLLPLAPIEFTCGSFINPYEYLGDIDCAFVFSSCMKPELVKELSNAIGRQCKPGTIIITTEFPLFLSGTIPLDDDESMPHGEYEIQLLEKIDGWCWLLGGKSTAYIHRVQTSLWEEYDGPRAMPKPSLEEEAYQLVQLIESGKLIDANEFLRRVHNDMIFHGLPEEFIPNLDEKDEA